METKVKELIKKRASCKAKLTLFSNYLNVVLSCARLSDLQVTELETRLDKMDLLYNDYDKIQGEIELLMEDPAEAMGDRETFQNQYFSLVSSAREVQRHHSERRASVLVSSVQASDVNDVTQSKHSVVKLPQISLPHFDGSYQHWLEFRDTFDSLIHRNTLLDDISKFHYLRSSLKGAAALIIRSLDFNSGNYSIAWDLLTKRYNNNRLLVNNHVQSLFNVDQIEKESSKAVRHLVDITTKNLRALTILGQPTQHWDILIIYIMAQKLDTKTYIHWEEFRNTLSEAPTLSQFLTFLNNRADLLESVEESEINKNKTSNNKSNKQKSFAVTSNDCNNGSNKGSSSNCPMCKQSHVLFKCDSFRKLSSDVRNQKAKEYKVCLNCLNPGHSENKCKLWARCKYCKAKHNTLLHVDKDSEPPTSNQITDNVTLTAKAIQNTTSSTVLLSTARVKVRDSSGRSHVARVLLDNGSTANFITKELCGKLGSLKRNVNSKITGINQQTCKSTQSCSLTLESYSGNYKTTIDCLVLPEITKSLPSTLIDISTISLPSGICLADPHYYKPSSVDILLGAEQFWNILGTNTINLGKYQPRLYESKLGWLISGYIAQPSPSRDQPVCNFVQEIKPELTRFWELDSISEKHSLSAEERACEEHFLRTTTRGKDGRFIVKIPFKQSPEVLGDSYQMAKVRFLSLERRFDRDPVFKSRYIDFMREYLQLGHMSEDNNSNNNISYYLPHHGVMREQSTTTKLRVVFDASAVTTSGVSLNQLQMIGPTVQDDLYSILLRFRQHRYVVSADIEKMYRAIELNKSQRSLQKILFRFNQYEPLKTYVLNTVTYGTASAPYLATKSLVSLASQASNDGVKQAIQRDMYVDDYLGGCDTESATIQLCKEVSSILASAQFKLRKWQSNSPQVMKVILSSLDPNDNNILDLNRNQSPSTSKILGLNWVCDLDKLTFFINLPPTNKITKRYILSSISQIFDPLGLVGPCVVLAKITMQKLWLEKCSWDEPVSHDTQERWLSFVTTLPCLNNLYVPRHAFNFNHKLIELHIFTDASECAYGACVYVRCLNNDGTRTIHLLTSKNKVAPIKHTTIPRLELCGALLGARLCAKVVASLTIKINKFYYWCDSTIVLCWLSTSPNKLKPFVRNRVSEIQESTGENSWRYVSSKENPADLVSRGLRADQIGTCSLWWSGPEFLNFGEDRWPNMPNIGSNSNIPEIKVHLLDNYESTQSVISRLISNKSNINKLKRIIAYILRFIFNLKNPNDRLCGQLSCDELQEAFTVMLRISQMEMFPDEYKTLSLKKALSRKNRLVSLSPFLDDRGVIRVGGRLDNANYCYDIKHPILLDSKHHITKILFRCEHLKLMHAGPQLLLSHIRQTYWPLGGRNLSKGIFRECVKCSRFRTQAVQPVMGQLPCTRTQLEFPFYNCSVDYAGPMLIADRKGRGTRLIKSYICVFVCLAVKAVHLELVTDLTKDAYLAALKRFVARRGKPHSILSDNGTAFVGVFNELAQFLSNSNLETDLAQDGIKFSFTPPYSPHFNGITEAAVKSTKKHLKTIVHSSHLTYEEMNTYLVQIEAILNSRPLIALSSSPDDLTALTPSHFLIGRPLISVSQPQVHSINITRLDRYKRIEHLRQHFWNRFSHEYVVMLQQRTRWHASTGELKLNQLVLIREKTQPPLRWLMGRIIKVFPGPDGITRVAEIKTKKGNITRAFNNICPLPIEDNVSTRAGCSETSRT